ncbi:MAG: FecR domain-containing protein [Bacteroidota bacterium]|nr:FecR domain-containing protein [Bacteroidota bacterium]
MKKTVQLLMVIVLTVPFITVSSPAADAKKPIATVFKPVGTVEYQAEGKNWTKATPAIPLYPGDRVRTGERSFVIIKFLENSILRVQEKSEIRINGEISADKEFSKNVYVRQGQLGFNVQKHPNEKFEFTTPTSVASIRGTQGLLTSSDSSFQLILGSGVVIVTNLISNRNITVNGGQAATSLANGQLTIRQATQEELNHMHQGSSENGGGQGQGQGNQGGNQGGQSSGTSSGGAMTFGFNVTSPSVTEGSSFDVTVEFTQMSVPLDTLKTLVSYFALAYKAPSAVTYKEIPGTITGSSVKFTIPEADAVAPSIQVYVILKTKTGAQVTYPQTNPESNPIVIPIQSAKTNEVRIEFTDPSGNRKTMVIEY